MSGELLSKTRTGKRNQAGNESIAGLEAGKYNIDWKLECRKRTMYRSRMPKLNQVN
jgi:hypothetical protein